MNTRRYNRVAQSFSRVQSFTGLLPTLTTTEPADRIMQIFKRLLVRPNVLQRLNIAQDMPTVDMLVDVVLYKVTPGAELPALLRGTCLNHRVDMLLYALCTGTWSLGKHRTLTDYAVDVLDQALPGDLAISRLRWMVFCAGASGQELRNGRGIWDPLYFRMLAGLNRRGVAERVQVLHALFNCRLKTARYMSIFLLVFFDLWHLLPLFAGRELIAAYRYGRAIHAVFCVTYFLQDVTLYRDLRKNKHLRWILSHVGVEFRPRGRLGHLRSDVWLGSRLLAQMQAFCTLFPHMSNGYLLLAAGQRSLQDVVKVLTTEPIMQVMLPVFTNLFKQPYTNWRHLTALLAAFPTDGRVMFALLTVATRHHRWNPALARQMVGRWMGHCRHQTVLIRVFLFIGRTADADLFRRFVAQDLLTVGAFPLDRCCWDKFLVLLIKHISGRSHQRAARARLMLAGCITAGMSALPNARRVPLCLKAAMHVRGMRLLLLLFQCGFFSPAHLLRLGATDHDLLPKLMQSQPGDPQLPSKMAWFMVSAERPRSLAQQAVLSLSRHMGVGPKRKTHLLRFGDQLNNGPARKMVTQLFFQEELAKAGL